MKRFLLLTVGTLLLANAGITAARTITIEGLDSMRFSKESITVRAGERVTIKLVNNTHLPASVMSHNWVLLAAGVNARKFDDAASRAGRSNDYLPRGHQSQILAHTDLVAGGESDTVTFTAPKKPGKYEYICTFAQHFEMGMRGTLIVKPG